MKVDTVWSGNGVVCARPRPNARLRLLCLPAAGASARGFASWNESVPSDVEVWYLDPAGHGSRLLERPLTSVEDVAEDMIESVGPLFTRPFALVGHSLGAYFAFEMARRMPAHARHQLQFLACLAVGAPQIPSRERPIFGLPRGRFVRAIDGLGGSPPEVLGDEELMDLYLPVLRSEFRASYRYRGQKRSVIESPIVTVTGIRDRTVSRLMANAWQRCTRGTWRSAEIDGGHFFPLQDGEACARIVLREWLKGSERRIRRVGFDQSQFSVRLGNP